MDQSGDAEFLVFDAPVWGLRALGRVLRTYYRKYGDVTVRRMIARYAPPTENDTGAYVSAVSQFLGVDADATLRCDAETWVKLMRVIVRHENGLGDYYPVALYWDAANRALS
ncbi:hypothetical protein [Elstera litoralis]|uniref:hypothetical protein n=1 Tax=Elstera litoralis TaxID=552518 RepID=UPI0018DE234B|nr:hypothetical protein [Elstera litoralis]